MHRAIKPRPHHLRDAAGVVAVCLVDLRLQHRLHVSRLNTDHRQACFSESAEQPLRQWPSFQSNSLEVVGGVRQHRQESVRFTRQLHFPHDPARVIHNADTRLIDRNVQSSKMVHAALLLLMLEAVTHGPRFTISLKRSTQNLQLSTSSPADYPIFREQTGRDLLLLSSQLDPLSGHRTYLVPGGLCRQFELENRTSVDAWRHPNPTIVLLDDRTADDKAHPHPIRFGRKKRLENPIDVGWINPRARIFNRDTHHTRVGLISLDFQHASLNRLHSLDGIHDEVQDDLLQLHLVAFHDRNVLVELRLKLHAVLLQIDPYKSQDCQNDPVDVDRNYLVCAFPEHRANARDDVACTMAGSHNAFQCRFCLFNIGLFHAKPTQSCTGPGYDTGQRLADLVSESG